MIYIKELPYQRRERISIAAINNPKQKTLVEFIDQDRINKKRNQNVQN